ncbi:hypothetical protein LTR09_009568 [Extremus antarcticus]|uniref:F-box domain-containing protein n=1 Tax=Extremus antarcticus TaxID=702011 RepID=A0AAJ0D8V7_9PEZI|nr:hypothetical protein LTR09_009568 [Extremus antarcticus]
MATSPPAMDAMFGTFELVEAIIECLPASDIARCKCVCHTFRHVIDSTASKMIKTKTNLEPLPKRYRAEYGCLETCCLPEVRVAEAKHFGIREDLIYMAAVTGRVIFLNPTLPFLRKAGYSATQPVFTIDVQQLLDRTKDEPANSKFLQALVYQPPRAAYISAMGHGIPEKALPRAARVYYYCSSRDGLTAKDLADTFVQINEDFKGKVDLRILSKFVVYLDKDGSAKLLQGGK